ncbi:ABC transporter substrate-binding protein [Streptomyces fractus]|uniref:ABC transporter substrate-binding protein n=1 Tax=Streptomyces fractus TaxID=641806 RepID=UPI003CF48D91
MAATATAATLIGVSACTDESGAAANKSNAGSLAFATTFGPLISFDPWLSPSGDNPTIIMNQMVYDSLTHVTPNGKVTPSLATSWKYTDPKTMVLKLRKGVKFDDGTPLDAAAVKANFDYAKKAVPAGQRTGYIAALTSTVVDPTTLELKSPTPQPDLPTDFATGGGYIVNPKALKHPSSLKAKPDGSGPYKLTQATSGQEWNFSRRAGHWDANDYPYQKLTMRNYSSVQALDNAMKAGQVQAGVGQMSFLGSDRAAGLNIHTSSPTTVSGVWLNDRAGKISPALGKVKVRQALNHAVDRAAIQKAVFHGIGKPASLIVPKGIDGFDATANAKYTYDPKKAKKLLAEAGYPNGFSFTYMSGADDPMAQAVAGYLRKVGVKMKIATRTSDYAQQLRSGKWAASGFSYTMVPPLQSMSELLAPKGPGNFNRSTDPEIQAQLKTAQEAPADTRKSAAEKLVTTVNDKAWFMILSHNPTIYVTGKKVTCEIGQRSVCPLYTFRPTQEK